MLRTYLTIAGGVLVVLVVAALIDTAAIGPTASTLGVLAALGIATWNVEERRRERREEQQAEARLVFVHPPVFDAVEDGGGMHTVVRNRTGHAIFDVTFEWWSTETPLDGQAFARTSPEIIEAGGTHDRYQPELHRDEFGVAGWRVRWRDRWGIEWSLDMNDQSTPDRFHGQDPRIPYTVTRGTSSN